MRFEDLIENHHDEILRYLWRIHYSSGRREGSATPEDLTQQTFERAYRAYSRLKSKDHLRAWLYRIATNCAMDELRRSGQEVELDQRQLPSSGGPASERALEQGLARMEDGHQLRQAIERLPAKQKAALVLRYLHELSYAECAQILETKQETVRANVYQALRKLRAEPMLKEEVMNG